MKGNKREKEIHKYGIKIKQIKKRKSKKIHQKK